MIDTSIMDGCFHCYNLKRGLLKHVGRRGIVGRKKKGVFPLYDTDCRSARAESIGPNLPLATDNSFFRTVLLFSLGLLEPAKNTRSFSSLLEAICWN